MYIIIDDTNNGYLIDVRNATKNNGRYVFKSTEILLMLEFVGALLNTKKVVVREK